MLRPGNAGSNDADDHLELLDQVIASLPAEYQVGHEPGDDPGLVRHHILVRADSAGATHNLVSGLTDANIEYSIGHPVDSGVREALLSFQEEDWRDALELDGTDRDGAWVAELTDLMDLSAWGEDARLICRRERPHPGAQLSLFDTSEGFRHTCFITNASAPQLRRRSTRVPTPRACPRRGPGPVLEGLRVTEPALRELHPEPCLGGHQPRRRGAHRLDADDLPRRRAQEGRAEDAARPAVARCRHPRASRPTAHLAPGRDLAVDGCTQAGVLEAAGRFSVTRRGPSARPDNGDHPEGVTSDKSRDL